MIDLVISAVYSYIDLPLVGIFNGINEQQAQSAHRTFEEGVSFKDILMCSNLYLEPLDKLHASIFGASIYHKVRAELHIFYQFAWL